MAYTTKQMGDACEMLVAAEMTLAGVPAHKMPDNWPGYDIIAQPIGKSPLRISVKSRTYKKGAAFFSYKKDDVFDWLAMIMLPGIGMEQRRFFIIPRTLADKLSRKDKLTSKTADERYWRIDEIDRMFANYENNFKLLEY